MLLFHLHLQRLRYVEFISNLIRRVVMTLRDYNVRMLRVLAFVWD